MNTLNCYNFDNLAQEITYRTNNFINIGYNYFNQRKDEWGNSLLKNSANSSIQNKKTILMIDDEEICLLSMEILLLGSLYSLIKANNSKEGIEYLENNPDAIDLIFLDLMMPDIYGLDLLAYIKNDPLLSKIPVIIQSGIANQNDIEKAYSLGASDFIRKPYKKDTVLNSIEKILK